MYKSPSKTGMILENEERKEFKGGYVLFKEMQ